MKNKWIFLFVFVAVNCMVIKAQEIFFEGTILFYYNTHPSDLISDGSYFALDSVRLITSKEKYAVWSDFSQKEVFMQDSSSKNYVSGKNFKIWDSVPQYSSIKSRNNYEHIGGDIYYDKENEIVIASSSNDGTICLWKYNTNDFEYNPQSPFPIIIPYLFK